MHNIWTNNEIDLGDIVWKYFRTDRFLTAIKSELLYFPSAKEFKDPFEGAVAVLSHDYYQDPRYPVFDNIDKAFAELRRLTKISCWNIANYESNAMWEMYGSMGKGVAITTTLSRIESSLHPYRIAPNFGEEEPYWGKVRYVDLHKERLKTSMQRTFFYKHRVFESEREFRIIISVRHAEEWGVKVPERGIQVPFSPKGLIESVYLGPKLSSDEKDEIVSTCLKAGLDARIEVSSLLGKPKYY